jgi:hypothetical protein
MLFVVGIQALGNPLCLAQRCAIEAILQKIDLCPHQMVFFLLRGAFLNKSKDRGSNQGPMEVGARPRLDQGP